MKNARDPNVGSLVGRTGQYGIGGMPLTIRPPLITCYVGPMLATLGQRPANVTCYLGPRCLLQLLIKAAYYSCLLLITAAHYNINDRFEE